MPVEKRNSSQFVLQKMSTPTIIPHMIHSQLHFNSISRRRLGTSHHTGIIYQHIESFAVLLKSKMSHKLKQISISIFRPINRTALQNFGLIEMMLGHILYSTRFHYGYQGRFPCGSLRISSYLYMPCKRVLLSSLIPMPFLCQCRYCNLSDYIQRRFKITLVVSYP